MHISKGHLLTVKTDVQRIRDAFFVGKLLIAKSCKVVHCTAQQMKECGFPFQYLALMLYGKWTVKRLCVFDFQVKRKNISNHDSS